MNSSPANRERARYLNSKAGRLEILRRVAKDFVVDDFLTFSIGEWRRGRSEILRRIYDHFSPAHLILRSSAVGEDGQGGRLAGAMRSEPGILSSDRKLLHQGITAVVKSFGRNGRKLRARDEIIAQRFLKKPQLSGVVLTWDRWHNRPYYVINYDRGSGRTNQITSGQPGETLRILRDLPLEKMSAPWRGVISVVRLIEKEFRNEILDVEFALDETGTMHVFQVRAIGATDTKQRRITASTARLLISVERDVKRILKRPSLKHGTMQTLLSDMADWNPAEMLGPRPAPLDRSIYEFLVTESAWNEGRASLGYSDLRGKGLMASVADKPYINTAVSLASLCPRNVPKRLRDRLVGYGVELLSKNPELHDKLEFSVAFSCFDFATDERLARLHHDGFSSTEVNTLRRELQRFTSSILQSSRCVIADDMHFMRSLRDAQRTLVNNERRFAEHLDRARELLLACRIRSIPVFSRLARLAFVGLAFLKSLRSVESVSDADLNAVVGSLNTIANDVHRACITVAKGKLELPEFLREFGHLRPMSYDITSARYDDMPAEFWLRRTDRELKPTFKRARLRRRTLSRITSALARHNIRCNGEDLLNFIKSAVEAREYAKFVFTKDISDALEHIAYCGGALGLGRNELSYLTIQDIFSPPGGARVNKQALAQSWRSSIRRNQNEKQRAASLALPPNIGSSTDLFIVQYPKVHPTFVTQRRVQGSGAILTRNVSRLNAASLRDAVVLLESADPGYDWVFAHNPKGIVTKYGGAGSHMTIRCAAFNVPAAIGCGEEMFERLTQAQNVHLDCRSGVVMPII